MSNRALSAIRTVLRYRLNEPSPGFWTNVALNTHIQTSYEETFALYLRKNPGQAKQYADVTYTAEAESVAVTISGYTLANVLVVEDRTEVQPGVVLTEADSFEQVIAEAEDPAAADNPTGDPSKWYYVRTSSASTGVLTIAGYIYLTPIPGSARSLRIHYQAEAQTLAGDSYTTGLPDTYEELLICRAAVLAKTQEGVTPSALAEFKAQAKEADLVVRTQTGGFSRGPSRIVYHDDTL